MAGASMKDIKLRIRSVESTMQITKAMQLVASSKLRQARARMEASRPYLQRAESVLLDITRRNTGMQSRYVRSSENADTAHSRRCYVVIAGDRGLAGSYNTGMFKRVEADVQGSDICVLPIGRKAREYFSRRNVPAVGEVERVEGLSLADCEYLARLLLDGFDKGRYDEIMLTFTSFVSVLNQESRIKRLLPLVHEAGTTQTDAMLYEPGAEGLVRQFLPQYLAGMIYAAACDSFASEQAARRVAMDSATKNASEMIDQLSLRYNRARQSSITQELTEIVAGAEH